ncbi:hypothetical protein DN748_12150 [Sinomicrobium soli]|nr:hypothetical protein DN748_12150 [Sinomicrobium sp. N-1-3-6]
MNSLVNKEETGSMVREVKNKVLLDHFYVVLDSSSYARFISHPFIKGSYAGIDLGLPGFEPPGQSATSVYLRGEEDYIEILGPHNRFQEPIGQNGIGFSLNGKEFSLDNKPILKETETKFLKGSDTASFTINDEETVWYKAFYTYGMDTNLFTWYSYYNPGFLKALHREEADDYSAKRFLKTAYKPDRLFKKITRIEIHCNKADHFRIARELQLLGNLHKETGKNHILFSVGDVQISILLDEALQDSRIARMDGLLNQRDDRVLHFGKLTIKNNGFETRWIFDPYP